MQTEPFRQVKAVHALTASGSNEAYTPPHIVDAVREALGGTIDLDPCSCALANEEVKASHFYARASTESYDDCTTLEGCSGGLFLPWGAKSNPTTVFVNPPGGFLNKETFEPSTRGASSASVWWETTYEAWASGEVDAAVYYCFRLDVLQTVQELDCPPPHSFPFCIFGERPRHWNKSTPREHRGQKGQPTHACAAFFLPSRKPGWGTNKSLQAFRTAFTPLGYVRI